MVRIRSNVCSITPRGCAAGVVVGIAILLVAVWLVLRNWLGFGFYWETAASVGLEVEQTHFPVADGYLAATLFRREHPRAAHGEPAVVLVHGTSPQGRSLLLYRMLARRLAARGVVVLLYDQRGYGESPDPPHRPDGTYALPWVSDAVAAAAFLARQPGVDADNVRLVGHSFGGSVAIGVTQVPGIQCRLSRIVILSPGRAVEQTGDRRFEFRARRLSTDMSLDPPLTVDDARALYRQLEVETLLADTHAVDVTLLHTSQEEDAHPLAPLIASTGSRTRFRVLPMTDHYIGSQRPFNSRNFPIKIYDAAALDAFTEVILGQVDHPPPDCRDRAVNDRPDSRERRTSAPATSLRLSVPEESRYLQWGENGPGVLVGDSITQAWMATGSDFDYREYLDALAGHGINATLLWSFIATSPGRRKADGRIGYDAPALWPWCGSDAQRNFDLRCLNPAYFNRLRDFVAYANERDIVVVLTVHDGWTKDRFDAHPFSAELGNGPLTAPGQYVELAKYGEELPAEYDPGWDWQHRNQYFQERFCARLVDELKDFGNVVYELFNEGEWYDADRRRQHEQHFLEFFRARTTAPLASNTDHTRIDESRRDDRVDVISLHSPQWSDGTETIGIFEHYARATQSTPLKPVLFSETVPAFSGEPRELDALTRVVWGTLLGGASVIVQDDVSFRYAPRSPMSRNFAQGDALLSRLGAAARFARDMNLERMQPDQGICSSGVCMVERGTAYVAYAEGAGEIWLDLTEVAGHAVDLEWYDTRKGTSIAAGSSIAEGRVVLQPPFEEAVLHVSVGQD